MFMLMLNSCKVCPGGGRESVHYPGMILKYKQGAAFSNYFHTSKRAINEGYSSPILYLRPLANDYFISLGCNFHDEWEYKGVIILSFTTEDYYNGNVPEDWLNHWEDYILVENPFREGGLLFDFFCEEDHGVPYYCEGCTNTNNIDTSCVNRLIANGEIWAYAQRVYLDTNTLKEVRK